MVASKGSYVLMADLANEVTLDVGGLGSHFFRAGCYLYVGSARGAGGLPARLGRHARAAKRVHWHIDYLLVRAKLIAAWVVEDDRPLECELAAAVSRLPGAAAPVRGFGSSDCGCHAHLFWLAEAPVDEVLRKVLPTRELESWEFGICSTSPKAWLFRGQTN
jgi:Uri superfamily endonuclease